MQRMTTAALAVVAAFASASLSGCGATEDPVSQNQPAEDAAPAAGAASADVPPEVAAELATLAESDRALAIKQRICPVAEKLLGSMGQPVKLSVEGREVFICCEGCEEKLRSDPQQYFQKLDEETL